VLKKALLMAVAVLAMGGVVACEEAGENMDNAIDDVRGERDLSDGALEKTGEAIDNVVGVERKNDADSLGDAVDGDAATKPN
jgi:hypothetical protein